MHAVLPSKSATALLLGKSAATGALGGLLFGFDTAVIAGITHALTERYHLSPANLGFTVSIALWGTVIGSIFSGIARLRVGWRLECVPLLPLSGRTGHRRVLRARPGLTSRSLRPQNGEGVWLASSK